MTASLMDDLMAAPDEPEKVDSLFGPAITEDDDGAKLTREGRVRRPRRPRTPRVDPETGEPLPPQTRAPRNAKLNEDLLEFTVVFASSLSAVAPTAAGVLIARAETISNGLTKLATGHKRTTAVLKSVVSVGAMTETLTTIVMFVAALAVDFGRLDAASPVLDNIGYAELVRDDRGKLQRDNRGMVVKDSHTLRDIYNTMHDIETDDQPQEAPMPGPVFSPVTGTGATKMPPMNWVPK
jgi:hypothetical protein